MTFEYWKPELRYQRWFRKEQGRFLNQARLRSGLSVKDVAHRTGVDIRWVESGEVSLRMGNLLYLVRLYRFALADYATWQHFVGIKIRQMAPPAPLRCLAD